MEQVRIFRDSAYNLEKKINEWLAWAGDAIRVLRVTQASHSYTNVIVIFYHVCEGKSLPAEGDPEKEEGAPAEPEHGTFCKHGTCKDHQPDWKIVGKEWRPVEVEPPGWFAILAPQVPECCNEPMKAVELIVLRACTRCEAKSEGEDRDTYWRCSCCGNCEDR